jgi:trypsin
VKSTHRVLLGALVAALGTTFAATPALAAPKNPQHRIVGGSNVTPGKYPFMVSVQLSGSHYCGGTLIDANWVLTAAHCTVGKAASSFKAKVGITYLSENATGKTYNVSAIKIHPGYGTPKSDSNDASLLQLSGTVNTTNYPPIHISNSTYDYLEAAGTGLVTAGWGTTKSGTRCCPDQMREVTVPAVSDASCGTSYGSSFDAATMVCAGERGKDSCQGDSGGPLFAATGIGYVEVGVVSWGIGCARKGYPGVYTELNNAGIRSWIQSWVPSIGS